MDIVKMTKTTMGQLEKSLNQGIQSEKATQKEAEKKDQAFKGDIAGLAQTERDMKRAIVNSGSKEITPEMRQDIVNMLQDPEVQAQIDRAAEEMARLQETLASLKKEFGIE